MLSIEKIKPLPLVLLSAIIFDVVASFILWNYHGMIENNPIMLWALNKGVIYWLISAVKIGLAGFLYCIYPQFKRAIAGVTAIYLIVWIQYFGGLLV